VAGSFIGALTDLGVDETEAQYYAEAVRRGAGLVTVRADESRVRRRNASCATMARSTSKTVSCSGRAKAGRATTRTPSRTRSTRSSATAPLSRAAAAARTMSKPNSDAATAAGEPRPLLPPQQQHRPVLPASRHLPASAPVTAQISRSTDAAATEQIDDRQQDHRADEGNQESGETEVVAVDGASARNGATTKPATSAPMMPTTTLRMMPCCRRSS